MRVSVEVDERGWSASFDIAPHHYTAAYVSDKLAFEARRLVEEAS